MFSTGKVALLLRMKNMIIHEVLQTIYYIYIYSIYIYNYMYIGIYIACIHREGEKKRQRDSHLVRNGLADINSFYIKTDA